MLIFDASDLPYKFNSGIIELILLSSRNGKETIETLISQLWIQMVWKIIMDLNHNIDLKYVDSAQKVCDKKMILVDLNE